MLVLGNERVVGLSRDRTRYYNKGVSSQGGGDQGEKENLKAHFNEPIT